LSVRPNGGKVGHAAAPTVRRTKEVGAVHARSTTFRGVPDHIDAGITFVRDEVMPAVLRFDGCLGLSMLVDRDTGGAIVTSSWESEEAMQATSVAVGTLRDRAARLFGSRPEVREWEIAVLHRDRPAPAGACARVSWMQVDPAGVEQMVETFRVSMLPQVEDLPGFCSVSLLVDRATGRSATSAVYESRQMLERSREAASDLRGSATWTTAAQVLDVAEFEVALAHLRVPETV
jgi:quinol monooxygenase YgiN